MVDHIISSIQIRNNFNYFQHISSNKGKLFKTYISNEFNYCKNMNRHMKMFGVDHIVPINQFEWEKLTTIEEMRLYILK